MKMKSMITLTAFLFSMLSIAAAAEPTAAADTDTDIDSAQVQATDDANDADGPQDAADNTDDLDITDDAGEDASEAVGATSTGEINYNDSDVRNDHIDEICDAACASASIYDQCNTSCSDQIHACFDQCDALTSRKNDCFVSCTNIAVDEREYQEEQAAKLEKYLDVEEVYGRDFAVGGNFFGAIHKVPNFALDAFYEFNMHHWEDRAKYIYGGELVFRFKDTHDFLLTVDYGQYDTPDGWWVRKDRDATAVEWVHNDMAGIAITAAWNGIHNFDKKKRVQLYGGVGLGALIKRGDFNKAKVRLGCVLPDTDMSKFDNMTPEGPCPEDNGDVLIQSADGDGPEWVPENIPSVLPLLTANLGFRYIIADIVSVGVEAGFRTVSFYGGAKVGVIFGKSKKNSVLEERQKKAQQAIGGSQRK